MRQIFFLAILILLASVSVFAEEETNLSRIQASVEKNESALKSLMQKQRETEVSLANKAKQLQDLRERAKNLTAELENIKKEIDTVNQELIQIDEKQTTLKARSAARLRVLFLRQRDFQAAKFALLSNSEKILRDAYFVSKFEQSDLEMFRELLDLQTKKKQNIEKSQELLQSQDKVKEKLIHEQQSLMLSIQEEKGLRIRLQQEKNKTEKLLVSLRAEALRLETVMRSLTGAGTTNIVLPKRDLISSHGEAATGKFEGQGLTKGELVLPITAKVVRGFGQKTSGFRGLLASKGIWYSAASGAPVYAVTTGKVMYHGMMPAYGTIIILDHGKRLYSLYGRVKDVRVQVGSVVEAGSELAKAEDVSKDKENFYFEIREAGTSVDPAKYMK